MPASLRSRSRTRGGAGSSPERSSPRKGVPSPTCSLPACPVKLSQNCRIVLGVVFGLLVSIGAIYDTNRRCTWKLSSNAMSDKLAFSFRCLLISGVSIAMLIKYTCKF